MSRVKCLACSIRIEFAPASPCSYRRVVNRNRLRTQSRTNKKVKGTAQTHHGRRPIKPVDPVEPPADGPTEPSAGPAVSSSGVTEPDPDTAVRGSPPAAMLRWSWP
jgi:hypothetical protein